MSTTFDVLPTVAEIPSFSRILELANQKLSQYLQSYNLNVLAKIKARIESYTDNDLLIDCTNLLMEWKPENYACFYIERYTTCIEVRFGETDQLVRDIWHDEIELKCATKEKQELIEKGLSIGHYWQFKRYSSQPPIYDLIYGIVAGCVAELTDGVINTDDGAWDASIFPACAREFFRSYLIFESQVEEEYRQWIVSLINLLKELE